MGSWWVPGSDTRVGGQLTMEPPCQLTVAGSLVPDPADDDALAVYPVIHGEASGKQVSLLNASSFSSFAGRFATEEEWLGDAVIESHVYTEDGEPPFSKLRTTLPYLHVWLGIGPMSVEDLPDEKGVRVVAKPAVLHDSEIQDGVRLQLYHSLAVKPEVGVLTLKQPVNVVVTLETPIPWRRIVNHYLAPFEALLWLASTRHVGSEDLWIWHQSNPDWHPKWVQLHAPFVRPLESGRGKRALHRYELLFLAEELPGGFAVGLQRWYRLWDKYSPIIEPLMALDRAPFSYTDDRFSTSVAAAEGYHRLRFGDRDLPKLEHRQRVEALREVIADHAPTLSEWIVPIAKGANRIPLKRRLKCLMSLTDNVGITLAGEHQDRFVQEIDELRNGYAHGRYSQSRLRADSGARHWAAEAVKWLIRTAILGELGFTDAEVARRVTKHPDFVFVGDKVREFLKVE